MNTDMKKKFAFKGASYKEDCGIYLSQALKDFSFTARLLPQGVTIEIEERDVERIRAELQKELGHEVRVFTPLTKT
jgi:hypothetical protein